MLRIGFTTVSIIPDADARTSGKIVYATHGKPLVVRTDPSIGVLPRREEERIRSKIVVTLAGRIAEERHLGRITAKTVNGAKRDRRSALRMANAIVPSPELETYLAWLDVRATSLVNQSWPHIEAVAAALLERRRLSGAAARRTISESLRAEHESGEWLAARLLNEFDAHEEPSYAHQRDR